MGPMFGVTLTVVLSCLVHSGKEAESIRYIEDSSTLLTIRALSEITTMLLTRDCQSAHEFVYKSPFSSDGIEILTSNSS